MALVFAMDELVEAAIHALKLVVSDWSMSS